MLQTSACVDDCVDVYVSEMVVNRTSDGTNARTEGCSPLEAPGQAPLTLTRARHKQAATFPNAQQGFARELATNHDALLVNHRGTS